MADVKISELTQASAPAAADTLIIEGTSGTQKIPYSALEKSVVDKAIVSLNHKTTYRGIKIGDKVSDTQKTEIQNGTFGGMYIGDYWTINNVNWRIAAMDYWLICGDNGHVFTKHHLVIVPDSSLGSHAMNTSTGTTGGYITSEMYIQYLPTITCIVEKAFQGMVLTHREYLSNAVTNGHVSGASWYDSKVDLMNEFEVYGHSAYLAVNDGTTVPINATISKTQFPMFFYNPSLINQGRYWYWLRDVVSSSDFASVSAYGGATYNPASHVYGVRPAFAIGVQ